MSGIMLSPSRRMALLGATALLSGCAAARIADRAEARAAGRAAPPVASAGASDRFIAQGGLAFDTVDGVWRDGARNRDIPWRAYLPKAAAPAPVVLFSHGGGGTRESGAQYGQHLASHGFAAIHPQHAGSDRDAFRTNPQEISRAAREPQAGAVRFIDIQFIAKQMASAGAPFAGRVDASRMGISGHSFGAITAQIAAGQYVNGFEQTLAVPAFKAAFLLSPSPPRPAYADVNTAFDRMLMPLFHLTGTLDDAPNGDFNAAARRIPYDKTTTVDQYLLILEGANHFTFGGDPNPRLGPRDFSYPGLARHHALIKAAAAAYWAMIFNADANARAYLDAGGFRAQLAGGDRFESKAKA